MDDVDSYDDDDDDDDDDSDDDISYNTVMIFKMQKRFNLILEWWIDR